MPGFTPGPLFGVPIAIKDPMDVAGLRTTVGSAAFGAEAGGVEMIPETDSALVARLRAAGAIILGKTNVPDFSRTGSNSNSSLAGIDAQRLQPRADAGRVERRLRRGRGDGHGRARDGRRNRIVDHQPVVGRVDRGHQADVRHGAVVGRVSVAGLFSGHGWPIRQDGARRGADVRHHGGTELRRSQAESQRRRRAAGRICEVHRGSSDGAGGRGSACTGRATTM